MDEARLLRNDNRGQNRVTAAAPEIESRRLARYALDEAIVQVVCRMAARSDEGEFEYVTKSRRSEAGVEIEKSCAERLFVGRQ